MGNEIEKTPAFGLRTLFVVGVQRISEIVSCAEAWQCTHIYLGANQSFQPADWKLGDDIRWRSMVDTLLEQHNFLVTLDLDAQYQEWLQTLIMAQHYNFIPMISVKLPNIELLNPNATIKLDDAGFAKTNPGVWCGQLSELLEQTHFTGWDEYGKDTTID